MVRVRVGQPVNSRTEKTYGKDAYALGYCAQRWRVLHALSRHWAETTLILLASSLSGLGEARQGEQTRGQD
jgi:hypothetical protein